MSPELPELERHGRLIELNRVRAEVARLKRFPDVVAGLQYTVIGEGGADAWERVGTGSAVYVGGKMGKPPRLGDRLPLEVLDQKCVLHIVGETIGWYAAHVQKGERFGETLDRVGVDELARSFSTRRDALARVCSRRLTLAKSGR